MSIVAVNIAVMFYENMIAGELRRNTIYVGHVLSILQKLPSESVDLVLFSPPYYEKRNYTETAGVVVVEPVFWDGDPSCDHEWEKVKPARQATPGDLPGLNSKINRNKTKNENRPAKTTSVCVKCGGWLGDLGNEPTFTLFIKHLADICSEIKRILKPWGCLFVNLGDSYGGSGGSGGEWNTGKKAGEGRWKQPKLDYPSQCLMLVPARFAIEMIDNRGWICRNDNIWTKPSPKPEPDYLRFVSDHEYVFFFTKNNKGSVFFYLNKKTMKMQIEKPPGIKGDEGIDWRWIPHKICGGTKNSGGSGWIKHNACNGKGCPDCTEGWIKCRCENGWIRLTFWRSYPYYFNQMYEPLKHPEVKGGCKIGGNKAESYGNPTISGNEYSAENLGGRNMRDVWNISTSKYKGTSKHKGGHTAVWPTKLAERIIDCACPRKICSKCGLPRVRYKNKWSDCGCGAPFNSGVDLDCFWGAGTTGIASMKHGVDVVGCEIKQDYAEESIERIKEEQEHNRSREKTGLKKSRHVKMDEKQSSLDGFATG